MDKLQYSIRLDQSSGRYYVILWNADRIVTDFGDYETYGDALAGANRDSVGRQDCPAPIKGAA